MVAGIGIQTYPARCHLQTEWRESSCLMLYKVLSAWPTPPDLWRPLSTHDLRFCLCPTQAICLKQTSLSVMVFFFFKPKASLFCITQVPYFIDTSRAPYHLSLVVFSDPIFISMPSTPHSSHTSPPYPLLNKARDSRISRFLTPTILSTQNVSSISPLLKMRAFFTGKPNSSLPL